MSKKELLGSSTRGIPFIISAPAGTGKTTLANMLCEEFSNVIRSISYTTREPRGKEKDGVDYFFISEQEFNDKKNQGDFVETAEIYDQQYGTSKSHLEHLLEQGNHVLLVIDTQGAQKIRQVIDAVSIFISPPSMEVLEKRLKNRKTESPEKLQERLNFAQRELQTKDQYDYHIINDDLNQAYKELRTIVCNEVLDKKGKQQ